MVNPIVENYQKKNNSVFKNFMSNLSTGKIIVIIGCILLLIAFSKSGDKRITYVIFGGLILIILYLLFKPSNEKILLNLETAKEVATDYLERLRVKGREIPFDSKIEVMPVGQTCYKDDALTGQSVPVSIDIGFTEYVHGTSFKKEGVVSIHPYDGTITGMSWMPLGYTGREKTTVTKIVPVGVMNIQGGTTPQDYKPA